MPLHGDLLGYLWFSAGALVFLAVVLIFVASWAGAEVVRADHPDQQHPAG